MDGEKAEWTNGQGDAYNEEKIELPADMNIQDKKGNFQLYFSGRQLPEILLLPSNSRKLQ